MKTTLLPQRPWLQGGSVAQIQSPVHAFQALQEHVWPCFSTPFPWVPQSFFSPFTPRQSVLLTLKSMDRLYHRGSQFSSVQSLSRVQLSATPWIAARQAFLSITNSRSLLKLMSIKSVMPSNHLILCRPLLLLPPIPPSIRVFSNESTLRMRWPTYWSFSFSISPSNEHPGLISIRMDWLDLLAVQGSQESSPTPQFKSINSSVLSFLHSPTLTSIHDHWKNHSLDYMDLCWQSNVCFLICYLGWS